MEPARPIFIVLDGGGLGGKSHFIEDIFTTIMTPGYMQPPPLNMPLGPEPPRNRFSASIPPRNPRRNSQRTCEICEQRRLSAVGEMRHHHQAPAHDCACAPLRTPESLVLDALGVDLDGLRFGAAADAGFIEEEDYEPPDDFDTLNTNPAHSYIHEYHYLTAHDYGPCQTQACYGTAGAAAASATATDVR